MNMDKLINEEIARIKSLMNEQEEPCGTIAVYNSTLEPVIKLYLSYFDADLNSFINKRLGDNGDESYMSKKLVSEIKDVLESQLPNLHKIIRNSVRSGYGLIGPYNMEADITVVMNNVFNVIKSTMNSVKYSVPLSAYVDSSNVDKIKDGLNSTLTGIFGDFYRRVFQKYAYFGRTPQNVSLYDLMNKQYCNSKCVNPEITSGDNRGICFQTKDYDRHNITQYSFNSYIANNIEKINSEIDRFV